MRTSPSEQRKITARLATRGPIPKGRAAFCAEDPPARIPPPAPVGAAPVRLCPVQHQRPGPLQAAQPTEHLAAFGVAGPWPSERATSQRFASLRHLGESRRVRYRETCQRPVAGIFRPSSSGMNLPNGAPVQHSLPLEAFVWRDSNT